MKRSITLKPKDTSSPAFFQWLLKPFMFLILAIKDRSWKCKDPMTVETPNTWVSTIQCTAAFNISVLSFWLAVLRRKCLLSSQLSDFLQSFQCWHSVFSDSVHAQPPKRESEWAGWTQISPQYNYRFHVIVVSVLAQLNKLQPAYLWLEWESKWWCKYC